MAEPRILLSAYQCAPGLGSVSQIGWEWYSRLAQRTSITLVTHIRNREALEKAGAPLPGSEVVFIDTEWFAGPLYRIAARLFPKSQHAVFLISSLDFYLYDRTAANLLRKRDASDQWDVIHAPTPVSPMAATGLYKLGLPLIVGPWNGGLGSPSGFSEVLRKDSGWIYRLRNAGIWIDRFVGCTKNAQVILSATKASDESVPAEYRKRIRRMSENGVDLGIFRPACCPLPDASTTQPLRVLFVGRLIPVKGVSMLLQAIELVRNEVNLELTIVGDGPCRREIEQEIFQRDLGRMVSLLAGNLSLPQVAAQLQRSHLFCLPSIRESGGAVLLEAMACAVPPVALNYGGPAEILNDNVGRLIPADNPETVIAGLANALRDAFRNPDEWRARGFSGYNLVRSAFGWDAKIDQALQLYRELAAKGSSA